MQRDVYRSGRALASFCFVLLLSLPAIAQETAAGANGPYDCLIEPSAVIELAAPVAGVVSEMRVDRGDRVVRGQVLARLEDRLERAALAVARLRAESSATVETKRARLAFEERRLARNERLISGNIITEKEADEIRTSKEVATWELREAEEMSALARLQLAQAEAELSLREVHSPGDGVVIERNREPGETTSGEHLVRIATLDPLYAEVFVPATMVNQLAPAVSASVVTENAAGRPLKASVKVIDPVADAASGMVKVRLSVENSAYRELSGLRCTATFDTPSPVAVSTPASAKP
jgi:RND family efflux transporter MFP subunit